jgi:hypothetical protein
LQDPIRRSTNQLHADPQSLLSAHLGMNFSEFPGRLNR